MTTPAPRYSARYLRYVLGVVCLISIFNTMDRTVVAVLLQNIKADLALTDFELGLVSGPAFAIVHFVAGIPIARLADRGPRRTIIAAGLFVWSAMTALTGLAQGFAHLIVVRMGVGIGEAAGSPPSASLLSDYFPARRRARAMSMITIGAIAGLGVGLVAGGWLGETYGWRTALVVLGLPGVGVALLVRFSIQEPPRGFSDPGGATSPAQQEPLLQVLRYLASIPSFRWVVFGACLASITTLGKTLWEPSFLIRSYGLSPAETGLTYFLIAALPTGIGAWGGASLADRLAARDERFGVWLCAAANAAVFPCMAAFLLWPVDQHWLGVPVAFYFSVVASLLGGCFSPIVMAITQTLARPAMRALAHAIWTMFFNLIGMGIGPALVGALSMQWQPSLGNDSLRYALLVAGIVVIPSALCFAMAARSLREDLAAARG